MEELYRLQEIRKEYSEKRKEIENLEASIKIHSLEGNLSKTNKEIEDVELRIKDLERKVRKEEMDYEELSLRKNELKEELYSASTGAKQLTGIQQKLEATETRLGETEEEVIQDSEKIEELEVEKEKLQEQRKRIEEDLAVERANYEGEFQAIQNEMEDLKRQHKEQEQKIETKVLKVYNKKFEQFSVTALAAVANNICGGCNVHLPRYIISELKKGKELVTCENCGRILYYKK